MTPTIKRSTFVLLAFAIFARQATAQSAEVPANLSSQGMIDKARADSARYPYVAKDIEFMSGMIHHHAQALLMSNWAPSHNASPVIQRLAARIINAQQDDIRLMQTWLSDRRQPVPAATPGGMKMMMGGMEMEMRMAGMLTDKQLQELNDARGRDFDMLFLKYMIQHHKGATSMVKELFDTYGAGQDEKIFKFASDVNVDQTTEIARMQQMLALMEVGLGPT